MVGTVAVAIGLRYWVGLVGVMHRDHSLSALPQRSPDASVDGLEGSLLDYGGGGDQVHCKKKKIETKVRCMRLEPDTHNPLQSWLEITAVPYSQTESDFCN